MVETKKRLSTVQTFEKADFTFKILIAGNSGVGKSSILLRFADDAFCDEFLSTIGVDFKFKNIKVEDRVVKLNIWDTAGQERFHAITASYYRGAHGFIVTFALDDKTSFQNVQKWVDDIKSHGPKNAPIVLVGNKSDLVSYRVVDFELAKNFAESNGMKYFEVSARKGSNIQEVFQELSSEIIRTRLEDICKGFKEHTQLDLNAGATEKSTTCTCTIL